MKTRLKGPRLSSITIGLAAAGITLGLTAGSVLAAEVSDEDYKALQVHKTKQAEKQLQPHERPAPDNPTGTKASNLAEAATNPISPLMQFQLQNAYKPENHNSNGYANVTTLQTVIPVPLPWESVPMLITRTTAPYVTTPNFDGPVDRKSGMGDTDFLALFTPKLKAKGVQLGLGFNSSFPTAGDNDFTGSGKYEIGPSALYINMRTPTWQWGMFTHQLWNYANGRGGSDREDVSKLALQPVLVKHFAKGWYAGSPDTPQTYDFKSDKWTLALGAQVGRVMKLGKKQPVKLFGEVLYNPIDDNGPNAEWTVKGNITFLFPE